MLSQNMTDKIIDYIMSHGGDFAEVFAEHTRRDQLAMTGGNMSRHWQESNRASNPYIFRNPVCASLHR